MNERIITIFDTTLRDGEQSPGAIMTAENKLVIARQLDLLGVDVIEAGFPANSPYELSAVAEVARKIRRPVICALARAIPSDINGAWQAVSEAEFPRIHVFISSSDIHLMHQMRKDRDQVTKMAREGVERAKENCDDVEFSPMDATRTKPDYLYEIIQVAIEAGATTVNIPDTVGYAMPAEFADLIAGVFKNVPNINQAKVSVHCHNDLGQATANSLMAVKAGVHQIEGCINGIGERAGNTALEEVIMALHTRDDYFGVTTRINAQQISSTSQLVRRVTGMDVQANKAIVGANAFLHMSGIHQDAMVKERTTFEIMDPKRVGIDRENLGLVLGKTSGRAGFAAVVKRLGFSLDGQQFNTAFVLFKTEVEPGRSLTDQQVGEIVKRSIRI